MPAFTETDSLNRIFQFLVLTLFGFEGFSPADNWALSRRQADIWTNNNKE
jgi:hypothetical protein